MKSNTLKHGFFPLILTFALGSGGAQAAPDMVVVGYGGAGQKAQDVAFFQPFSAADGSKLIQSEYNGEMARIKVMVDTGSVDWDVVQIEGPDLMRGCDEGMYERLAWKTIGNADQLIPDAVQDCGSAALVWSVAIAYDTDKLAQAPASWADFWDVKKIPGKRGLRKRAVYNLEFALLADGVKVEDVYSVLSTPAFFKPLMIPWNRCPMLLEGSFCSLLLVLLSPLSGSFLLSFGVRRGAEWQSSRSGLAGQPVWHGLLGNHQRLQACRSGATFHCLYQPARCASKVRRADPLRPYQYPGRSATGPQTGRVGADLATEPDGCVTDECAVLG